MTAKRGPKWPWFSALRGPESGLADKMKQIEAPNRGQNPKEYPRNLGNPPLPRARVRAHFIGEKLGSVFARALVAILGCGVPCLFLRAPLVAAAGRFRLCGGPQPDRDAIANIGSGRRTRRFSFEPCYVGGICRLPHVPFACH